MSLTKSIRKSISTLENLGYTVEIDPEDAPGVGRITGHGVLVTLPLEDGQAEDDWAQWASHERHQDHLATLSADDLSAEDEAEALRERLKELEART